MTRAISNKNRVFLFLQGPHGPFFAQLADSLRRSGANALRVGFNAGDERYWGKRPGFLSYRGALQDWPEACADLLTEHNVTDLVLYGDVRPVHAAAINLATAANIKVHVFEEGYLRPYWVTYELGGSNGNSKLMALSIEQLAALTEQRQLDTPVPPSHWGDMREHIYYGAMYHWFVLCRNRGYPGFEPHRTISVAQEFRLYLRRLVFMPFQALERRVATWRVKLGSFPYHLALLQLAHDSSFQSHGPFKSQTEFVERVIRAFATGAPQHHHLVFKSHPLEDGRAPLRSEIRRFARRFGIADRVHYVRGGKLAGLLNDARSAVTVNSTSGQQALWRGIPLRSFGAAVYAKPELVSDQSLDAFFARPEPPNTDAYRVFRDFLLATSQLPGSYYAAKGRRQVIRKVTDMMLDGRDPYVTARLKTEAVRQQLHVVQTPKAG